MDSNEAVYTRLSARILLVQAWSSSRFDDHWGLELKAMTNSLGALTGLLARSKHEKPVSFNKCCWSEVKNWCDVGWCLQEMLTPDDRDCLMPSPCTHFGGIRRAEL